MKCNEPTCSTDFPEAAHKIFCSRKCRNTYHARLLNNKRREARAAGKTAKPGRHPDAPIMSVSDLPVRPWAPLKAPSTAQADNIARARAWHALPSYYGRKE